MKVFKIGQGGETDWVCANSILQALKYYRQETEMDIDDLDFIDEETNLDRVIKNMDACEDEPKEWTLREMVEGMVEPYILASTAY